MPEMQQVDAQGKQVPPLLTIAEVAAQLRVDPSTVYRWTSAGTLRAVRFAGSVRIPAEALHSFVTTTFKEAK